MITKCMAAIRGTAGTASVFLILMSFWSHFVFFVPSACADTEFKRPPLQPHQGYYFRWSAPAGWHHSESTNGVTLTAPDTKTKAMYAILLRSHGQSNPRSFLLFMMSKVPGYAYVRVDGIRNLPDQKSAIPGTFWRVIEADLSYTDGGVAVSGTFTCGVNVYYGMYDAMIIGYQAPKPAWFQAKQYLPAVARSIGITNTRQVAGNDRLIPVRNNPLDNSALIESWRQRGISEARISQARREGTMGYERMQDPVTGRIHHMPFETYDGGKGGYRNPDRPEELLVKPKAGE
jgi:hypothetical protein